MAELLRRVRITEVALGPVHVLKEKASVKEVLDLFANKNISSAPVVDDDNDPWGSIDTLDLIAYSQRKLEPEMAGRKLIPRRIDEFLCKAPIRNLLDISGRNSWKVISKNKTLIKAVRMLSYPSIHRVYVVDELNQPIGVVSQIDLVKFFLKHRTAFQDILSQPVEKIFPEKREVVGIRDSETVMEAFKHIYQNRVSGLAIVDDTGALVGNISANDIKYIKFSDPAAAMKLLAETPLKEYLDFRERRHDYFREESMMFHLKPVVVKIGEPFSKVLERAVDGGVHRVYVVNEEEALVDVISLGDMVAQFWQ